MRLYMYTFRTTDKDVQDARHQHTHTKLADSYGILHQRQGPGGCHDDDDNALSQIFNELNNVLLLQRAPVATGSFVVSDYMVPISTL